MELAAKGWVGAYKKNIPEKGWEIKMEILTVLSSGGAESTNWRRYRDNRTIRVLSIFHLILKSQGANSEKNIFVRLAENNQGQLLDWNTRY